ncbi:MAG: HEAT repeat domain-containing protein [Bryobacteraceae bacterium]
MLESIPLYLYGELGAPEEEGVEAHVFECAACRSELEQQRRLHAALEARQMEPPAMLAVECRRELTAAIARRDRKGGWLSAWAAPLWRPAGALALVALGFFSARLATNEAAMPAPSGEPVFSLVRSVQADEGGGVQIALDETRRRLVRGKPGDDQIERLLLSAARDEGNAGLRVESLEMLKGSGESTDVRNALVYAVTQDPNPGVRLKALEGLKSMASHPDVRKSLAQVLQRDTNAGVRIQAIDLLVQQRDGALVGVLQRLVNTEDNSYVRMRCKNALEEMNASVGTF